MAKSKKYKDKVCVYCRSEMSSTADHVFPKEMFQAHQRNMLPKVPACEKCNNEKSKLEHYLLTVLPFGATHSHAHKALTIDVKKRLDKNNRLHKDLSKGFSYTYIPKNKYNLEQRLAIELDSEILHEFVGYTCRGLIWHHWNKYLPLDCSLAAFTPSQTGVEFISKLSNLNSNLRVNVQLGEDTVRYRGIMSEIDEGLSVWGVQLLGGMTVSTENNSHFFSNSFVAVITGTTEMIDNLNFKS